MLFPQEFVRSIIPRPIDLSHKIQIFQNEPDSRLFNSIAEIYETSICQDDRQ